MASDVDDRFDRTRTTQVDRLTDKVHGVDKAVGELAVGLKSLGDKVDKGFEEVKSTFRDMNTKFVSREEHETLKGEVRDVRSNISRGAWLVLSLVFTALVYSLFKIGVVHL